MPRSAPRLQKDLVSKSSGAASAAPTDDGLCNTLEPEALQLTHTAYLDTSTPQAQEVVDGNGEKVTGKGVKVAWIADGIDIHNPSFIRADGSLVFIDYEDFSGDPAGTPTDGGRSFLWTASSIAAQDVSNGKLLTYDISQFVAAAHPLPSPCNIRIRGMAPGASLVGLKVFSTYGIYHDVFLSYRRSSGPSSMTRWTCSTNPLTATPIPTTTTTRFRWPTRPP
jgi:hypothetical protein